MVRSPSIRRQARAPPGRPPSMPESLEKPVTFPRRFPRLGSQFQTRIKKIPTPLERPPPSIMSEEYPHIIQGEESSMQIDVNESNDAVGSCRQGYEFTTQRGGLLLHTPSEHVEPFLGFCQPLVTSLSHSPPPQTPEVWKQHMIQLHGKAAPKKRSRAPRGGGPKRKREQEELVWDVERMVQEQRQNRHRLVIAGEDDQCVMQYLQLEHQGNVAPAELKVLVDVSAGRASKIRKCLQQKGVKDKLKLPPSTTSDSWRILYERSTFPSLLGFLQDDLDPRYPILQSKKNVHKNSWDEMTLGSDSDDLKGAWRSVLACGKSMERQLNGDACNQKPLLSTVVSFVRNAYALPIPESCFGTNHVMIEEVSSCLLTLLDHVDKARHEQAKLRDLLYDEAGEGVDMDSLQKFLDSTGKALPIRLDEAEELDTYRERVTEWEGRLAKILEPAATDGNVEGRHDLATVELLAAEAKTHAFVSKSLVQLQARIQKAHTIREKLIEWEKFCEQGEKNTIKAVASLVRDATRLKLIFPEVSRLLEFYREQENWVDRSNIAIRSRISLTEVKSLIKRGEEMPLDLSDHLDKLKSRVGTAEEWNEHLEEVCPCPKSSFGTQDMLSWMKAMRQALYDGKQAELHELASEGSRIPVEVDAVKLLQVELDAKNWTQKAKKWIPVDADSKRGKLDDLREHSEKAVALRDKLTLSEAERDVWILEGEAELDSIVEAADKWYEDYHPYLEGDNRRSSQQRACLSLGKLRQIVQEGNAIHANIGTATSKSTRILGQAEAWYEKYQSLLVRCKFEESERQPPRSVVDLSEMNKAVEAAAANISLDLDEAIDLKNLVIRVEKWFDRAMIAAPKRSKRHAKSKIKFTIADLVNLIDEASSLPVNTDEEMKRLQVQLNDIQKWRSHALHELNSVASGFEKLRENIVLAYGAPKEFNRDRGGKSTEEDDENMDEARDCHHSQDNGNSMDIEKMEKAASKDAGDGNMSQTDTASTAGSDSELGCFAQLEKGDFNVHRMIKDLLKGATGTGVITPEAEKAELLDHVSKWCIRSLKYLHSPREIFDKRFFGAFDRFITEGNELLETSKSAGTEDDQEADHLRESWGGIFSDQLERLEILRAEREEFTAWCDTAAQVLSDEKKLTVEKLQELAGSSRHFPAMTDMVQKVRGLSVKVTAWVESTKKAIESGKKLSMQDAKDILAAGEKLNVNCQELKTLRAALRTTRGWCNRVKRCNVEQGSIHVSTVKNLIKEHQLFLIEMPEELSLLRQAKQNYCICRRPYEGFMIGCDECEEWYHGSCIGISESRADRVDKYVCIRCSLKNIFKASATTLSDVIRKWTSRKDLKKSRQVEAQKHQRKVRKETKDAEKLRKEIKSLEEKLSAKAELTSSDGKCADFGATNTAAQGEPVSLTRPDPVPTVTLSTVDVEAVEDAAETNPPASARSSAEADMDTGSTEEDDVKEASTAAPSEPGSEKASSKNGSLSREDLEMKLDKASKALQIAGERLVVLTQKTLDRKNVEKMEDQKGEMLRRWCVRVRSLVLVPSTQEQVESARPLPQGCLSTAMDMILDDAAKLGIAQFPDVEVVTNCFNCVSWSLFAMSIVARKPTLGEMNSVVSQASSLDLPEEKALRTMKSMIQRAAQWQAKAVKALAPKPGQTKPVSVEMLKDLMAALEETPLRLPEAARVQVTIDDKGSRHCVCGGPSDGRFMVCCNKCDSWFHGACINVTEESSAELLKWLCANCSGGNPVAVNFPEGFTVDYDPDEVVGINPEEDDDESPHAPNPSKLWPPFGLLGSVEAAEALGGECCSISDDTAIILDSSDDDNAAQQKTQDVVAAIQTLSDAERIPGSAATLLNVAASHAILSLSAAANALPHASMTLSTLVFPQGALPAATADNTLVVEQPKAVIYAPPPNILVGEQTSALPANDPIFEQPNNSIYALAPASNPFVEPPRKATDASEVVFNALTEQATPFVPTLAPSFNAIANEAKAIIEQATASVPTPVPATDAIANEAKALIKQTSASVPMPVPSTNAIANEAKALIKQTAAGAPTPAPSTYTIANEAKDSVSTPWIEASAINASLLPPAPVNDLTVEQAKDSVLASAVSTPADENTKDLVPTPVPDIEPALGTDGQEKASDAMVIDTNVGSSADLQNSSACCKASSTNACVTCETANGESVAPIEMDEKAETTESKTIPTDFTGVCLDNAVAPFDTYSGHGAENRSSADEAVEESTKEPQNEPVPMDIDSTKLSNQTDAVDNPQPAGPPDVTQPNAGTDKTANSPGLIDNKQTEPSKRATKVEHVVPVPAETKDAPTLPFTQAVKECQTLVGNGFHPMYEKLSQPPKDPKPWQANGSHSNQECQLKTEGKRQYQDHSNQSNGDACDLTLPDVLAHAIKQKASV